MSQEWLKKLAELSNDKELVKRVEQLQRRPPPPAATAARAAPAGPRRGLLRAVFGHFLRFLILVGVVQAVAMFVVVTVDYLDNESWGMIFHYVVWYALTQPIFPPEAYDLLRDWVGVTRGDLHAFYAEINPALEAEQDVLVFAVPAAIALALTLFFLPAINAGRRRSPIRVLVYLANLSVIPLLGEMGEGVIVLWLAAFVFSWLGGGAARAPRPAPAEATSRPARPARSAPAAAATQPARRVPATSTASTAGATVERAGRAVAALKREPTVARRTGGGSWVRAR
jgi:hypothetical protein